VWELEPQADEGDQGPVKEDEPLLGPGPGGAAAHVTAAPLQGGLVGGGQGSASSAISSPSCCREIPVKTGWVRAARAHAGIDTHA
jgi:hypothetical protein